MRVPIALLAALLLAAPAFAQEREVPYWASLRETEVNMRAGHLPPSADPRLVMGPTQIGESGVHSSVPPSVPPSAFWAPAGPAAPATANVAVAAPSVSLRRTIRYV